MYTKEKTSHAQNKVPVYKTVGKTTRAINKNTRNIVRTALINTTGRILVPQDGTYQSVRFTASMQDNFREF